MRTETTVVDLFYNRVEQTGYRLAYKSKRNGVWEGKNWDTVCAISEAIANGLLSLGLGQEDRAAILSGTREEWVFADLGIVLAGGCTVPIYPSNLPKECSYIIENSDSSFLFLEDLDQLAKVKGIEAIESRVKNFILIEGNSSDEKVISLEELMSLGDDFRKSNPEELENRQASIKYDQLLTLIYTSGTTGPPKGVMLNHQNVIAEAEKVNLVADLTDEDEQLLFLPLAHIFAKILAFASIKVGSVISIAESMDTIAINAQEIKPTFMGAVPRVYEKVYAKINAGVESAPPNKQKIFNWALNTGKDYSQKIQEKKSIPLGLKLKNAVADKLVFSKLRATFGGRIKFFVSGGAPLSRGLADFFHSAGMLILEGYGLTETTGATHCNRPDNYKFGTVGQILPGVEMKIIEDGEILVRGDNIMMGYFKNEAASNEVLEKDGWFHTGDIGVLDPEGFLKITDRKKDLIITAGGKNVSPQNIENLLKLKKTISQVMVHGDKRKFLSAIVTLKEEFVEDFAKNKNLNLKYEDACNNQEIQDLVEKDIQSVNEDLASYETIKKFKVLPNNFSQETGELTPTLKVKRKVVTQKYQDILDSFYNDNVI